MKKIVIVDDDADMRELMAGLLRREYEVHAAADGAEGLELIRRVVPDLVVLDLHMPRMHGFELCQRLRADERLKGIKVLISSSKSYANDIKTALAAGADLFIIKPFEVAAFLNSVNQLLSGGKVSLRLRFWGTRGSVPSPGPLTARYGGNTACTELRVGNRLIIIDAGTGLRELGNALLQEHQGKPINGHIFIGHTHWDHIQGLPFFTPLYMPQNRFTLYGVHGTTTSFEEALGGQMSPSYFPVSMKDMEARRQIEELSGPVAIDDAKISYHYLNHPGITVGFRIQTPSWTVSYLSDHEPYSKLNNRVEFSAKEDDQVAQFVAGSDLLICEAQYTEEEYKIKRSWGHSTFSDVIGLAVKAKAKQLALFHHDPMHTDEMMDRHLAECREFIQKNGHPLSCFAAQEGMTLNL